MGRIHGDGKLSALILVGSRSHSTELTVGHSGNVTDLANIVKAPGHRSLASLSHRHPYPRHLPERVLELLVFLPMF